MDYTEVVRDIQQILMQISNPRIAGDGRIGYLVSREEYRELEQSMREFHKLAGREIVNGDEVHEFIPIVEMKILGVPVVKWYP